VSTSIDTGTEFVTMSNIAERALDCSTGARTFSAGASDEIVNLTADVLEAVAHAAR